MEPYDGIRVVGPPGERYDEVLTPEALTFSIICTTRSKNSPRPAGSAGGAPRSRCRR
jgi:hypothetical protein